LSGLLSPEASKRRRITCYKTILAVASIQPPADFRQYLESLDFTHLIPRMEFFHREETEVLHYCTVALVRWSTFCSVKVRLNTMANYLVQCNADIKRGVAVDLSPVISYLHSVSRLWFPVHGRRRHYASEIIPELLRAIIQTPHENLFQYIRDSSPLGSKPYRWRATQDVISLNAAPFSALDDTLARALEDASYHHSDELEAVKNGFYDTGVWELCSFWRPNEPGPIPYGILNYLANRNSDEALQEFLVQTPIGFHMWSCFLITLSCGPSAPPSWFFAPDTRDPNVVVNAAHWRLASLSADTLSPAQSEHLVEALQIVTNSSPVAFSSITMIKSIFLGSLVAASTNSSAPTPVVPD
jgi:hypothetical protein